MHIFYATSPIASVQSYFDGNQYITTTMAMCTNRQGKIHVRECDSPRMMRVSYVVDDIAYAELGKAGDAIACNTDLPISVVCNHVEDLPLEKDDGQYVVLNENTLGFIHRRAPNSLDVLHGSVIKGGHNWLNGPVAILHGSDKVRPATLADFNEYRVSPPPSYKTAPSVELAVA